MIGECLAGDGWSQHCLVIGERLNLELSIDRSMQVKRRDVNRMHGQEDNGITDTKIRKGLKASTIERVESHA
jgi:hypothetical protein